MQERLREAAGLRLTILVTGPVRSGKSTFALRLARESGKSPVYVATAELDPADVEMTDRIARHRGERGAMRTIECRERRGPSLETVLGDAAGDEVLVVDALGSWIGNLLAGEEARAARDPLALAASLARRAESCLAAVRTCRAEVIVVSEETGWGIVPAYPLGRIFRDTLGRLTAAIARRADRAYLVVAGIAVDLKAAGIPVLDEALGE